MISFCDDKFYETAEQIAPCGDPGRITKWD